MSQPVLRLRGIRKAFPGVRALNWEESDELSVNPGEIRALVGENGAGKSTLMQILAGICRRDAGEILLDGRPFEPSPATRTQPGGIGIILQEPGLISTLTVADNLFIGREALYTRRGLLQTRERDRLAQALLSRVSVDIPPRGHVHRLTLEEQKLVELARALSLDPRVLIVDETSAALSFQAARKLFQLLKLAKGEGRSVIFISHHLEEVFEHCDTVTVLKDGKLVATLPVAETDPKGLSSLMVGRELHAGAQRSGGVHGRSGEPLLRVRGLTLPGEYENVDLDLYPGEIAGVGGLVGSGGEAVGRTLFGDLSGATGEIRLAEKAFAVQGPSEAVAAGVGYVPKERDREGLILRFGITENVTLPAIATLRSRLGLLNRTREKRIAREQIGALGIRCRDETDVCINLSGGNRQKVVLAKWLVQPPRVLILNSPTRGVDVGAKAEIYRIIHQIVGKGTAVLLVTDELPELIGLSDQILIMRQGRVSARFTREDHPTEQELIQHML